MYQGDTINVWENKTKSYSSIHECKQCNQTRNCAINEIHE